MSTNGDRVLVAMSGGVDSSVAAALLRERGEDVVGVFLRTGAHSGSDAPGAERRCCSATDAADAAAVAERLSIPFYALDYAREFSRVMDDFAAEYAAGRTPNPCVRCNQWVKFGSLFDLADRVGARRVATGHYARIGGAPGRLRLRDARDARKNQVYFLFTLGQRELERAEFPVGGMTKDEVRAEAARLELPVQAKPESQEICFVPDGDHAAVVEARRPGAMADGPVLDLAGREVGRHDGLPRYTVGQRRGLSIPFGERRYVVRLDVARNAVIVGGPEDLRVEEIRVRDVRWADASAPPAGTEVRARVQIRYRHPAGAASIRVAGDGVADVRFDEPESGVSPGQAAVFFDGDEVLGGGWIAS